MDEILLQLGKFKVVRRMVEASGEEPVPKDLVIHPGAAAILPITDDGRLVMVRNWRWSVNRELLEIPAGTIETLEQPETCARRELEEETGYTAETWRLLCRFYTSPGILTELMTVFVATGLHPGSQNLSEDEKIEVEILSFEEVDKAIKSCRILDGKTLASLLFYRTMERNELV